MKKSEQFWFFFFLAFYITTSALAQEKRPNIIYFLADDLGYGETGVYGQEKIKTPNIDALAASGMRFTQHYSGAPVCAPARYMLLTGKHAGHAYIRGNDEWKERGDVWDYDAMFKNPSLEGQRPIPKETQTIAKLLKTKGYTTGIFGKWGLGAPNSEGTPNQQGFDEFYGYNCQRQAHNLYPTYLWENETRVLLRNTLIAPHQKWDSLANPNSNDFFDPFIQNDYAPTLIHEKALDFVETHQEEPFFLYYASPLPHLPLQAPSELVEPYRKVFGEEEPYLGDKGYFPNKYPRATYAAMISYLDQQLGELIAKLKALGLYENTLIIFSSDNGPTYTGGVDFDFFKSSAPFKNGYGRTKGFVYEGGIRVPMIASWPNHIKAGTTTDHISIFYDVLPTICDMWWAIEKPNAMDGLSFMPTLMGSRTNWNMNFCIGSFPVTKGSRP